MPGKKITSIKVKYNLKHDYKSVIVNGVYGGIAPNGNINVNFYLDRVPLPDETTLNIIDGKLKENYPVKEVPEITRDVVFGVQLNYDTAISIQNWLGNKIEELRKVKKGQNGK